VDGQNKIGMRHQTTSTIFKMKNLFTVFLTLQLAYASVDVNVDSDSTIIARFNEIQKERFPNLGDGGFVPPDRKKIEELKEKVDELENQIKILTESSSADKTTLKNKIVLLQEDIKALKDQLANSESATTDKINEMARQMQDLTEEIKRLTIRYLPDDCVRDIQAKRFAEAEKKLKIIAEEDELVDIFDRVYTRQEENIPLLDELANSLNDKNISILIYKYLAGEVKSHRDSDVMKVMRLYESMNQIFPSPIGDSSIKDTVETTSRKFMNLLKDMTQSKFTYDIFNGDFCKASTTSDVNYVLHAIGKFSREMFMQLIDNIVLEIYGDRLDEIFECISSSEFVELRIVASSVIFLKLRKKSQLDKPVVFKLAACIKGTMDLGNYVNVAPAVKDDFEKVKIGLPKVVVNIVFSSKVCVKNLRNNEYLYATDYLKDSERRYVYTWMKDTEKRFDQAYWKFEMQKDYYFRIKNHKFNEYMHLDETREVKGSVCTWVPKNPLEDIWYFTVEDDTGVSIHNKRYGRHLRTEGYYGKDNRRAVLAVNIGTPSWARNEIIWGIEDCSAEPDIDVD